MYNEFNKEVTMFPSNYPESCPPSDAVAPDGVISYCRLVSNPITKQDVKSNYELNPARTATCSDLAVSMFTTVKMLNRMLKDYARWGGKQIAWICPKPEWGLQRVGDNRGGYRHVNLWLYAQTNQEDVANSFIIKSSNEGDMQ
jgi:hypothetical protein